MIRAWLLSFGGCMRSSLISVDSDHLVMDNGLQFTSHEFQTFLADMGIHATPITVFNPCENGLVEHWNHILEGGIQAFCSLDCPWEEGS